MSTAKWFFYDSQYCPYTFLQQAFIVYILCLFVKAFIILIKHWKYQTVIINLSFIFNQGCGKHLKNSLNLKLMIFQDDIALVICMIILMAVTAGVVMFKVNKCFINFNRKVHIWDGVSSDLSNIYVSSIFSISTWSMFVLLPNYLK